jgi:hypothetical protein
MRDTFTEMDRRSTAWKHLKVILLARLETHRRMNDGNLTESETAKLRGRIAEIKFLLDLDTVPSPAPTSDAG